MNTPIRMRAVQTLAVVVVTVIALGACSGGGDAEGDVSEVVIGPELVDCVGVAPMRCMVVDGELFYGHIDGFEYEAGYEYRLRIERYDAWPDQEEPPQDASQYGYRLVEVLSKTSAG